MKRMYDENEINALIDKRQSKKYKHQIKVIGINSFVDKLTGVIEYVDNSNANITALTSITKNVSGNICFNLNIGTTEYLYIYTLYGKIGDGKINATSAQYSPDGMIFNKDAILTLNNVVIYSQNVEEI